MSTTVSIVMPVFNTEDLVGRAIQSVFSQTYRDFELIIIDDASTDRSVAAVHRALQDVVPDDRDKARVVARQRNQGYAAATTTGLSLARGEWVWFLDGDDWAEPDLLRSLVSAALTYAADIVIARMQTVRSATGEVKVVREWTPRTGVTSGHETLKHLARGKVGAFQTNKLISLDLWKGVQSPLGNAYADAAVMPELLRRAKRVAFVRVPLYNYFLRSGSVTGTLRSSLWDLTTLPEFVFPVLTKAFTAGEVRALQKTFLYSRVYWPLINSAAADREQTPLASEIQTWARDRMRWADLLWLATRGRVVLAANLGLAKSSPRIHGKAYKYYKGMAS